MQTFKKKERITEKKIIQDLFEKGNEFYISPFRLLWNVFPTDTSFPFRVLITVSHKNFKKAVDRNRIKRLVREAYRKNKHFLFEQSHQNNGSLCFIVQYTGREMPSYKELEEKIILILRRLVKDNEKVSG